MFNSANRNLEGECTRPIAVTFALSMIGQIPGLILYLFIVPASYWMDSWNGYDRRYEWPINITFLYCPILLLALYPYAHKGASQAKRAIWIAAAVTATFLAVGFITFPIWGAR